MRRRSVAAVLAVALGLPVLPLTAAGASGEPGSGFGSVSLRAVARGQEFLFRQEVPAQLSIPYATSSLQLGEGVALATVAWPGDVGASLGTTAVLLGAPEQLRVLNDPAIASGRSGSGDADVSNTTVPGTTMHITATKRKATALAAVDGSSAAAVTAGRTSSQTSVQLTGESSAVGSASTTIRDISLAGVLHISAVTSTTTGTTDGVHADASGSTTVTGVSVAGIPVTVDEHGVSVAGTGLVPPGAADAVTTALQQAQITLLLTKPFKAVAAGRVEYATSALIATTPLGTLTLGGAQLVLSATTRDATVTPPALTPQPPTAVLPGGTGTGVLQPPSVGPGGNGQPPVVPGTETLPPADGPSSLVPLSVRTGYGWAWLVSGLLLSLLAANALLGLNRRWLAPDLSGCPLERSPS